MRNSRSWRTKYSDKQVVDLGLSDEQVTGNEKNNHTGADDQIIPEWINLTFQKGQSTKSSQTQDVIFGPVAVMMWGRPCVWIPPPESLSSMFFSQVRNVYLIIPLHSVWSPPTTIWKSKHFLI